MTDFEHLDHYDLLGVSRSASADEIKRAYRREISKYHPDRFVKATPEEQLYARLRSQRLTEAYSVLSNLSTRIAYNRGLAAQAGQTTPRPPAPPQQRDHQAELYEQAQSHLEHGRLLQAIGVLRQLQKINPFYRDSAELLAAAEAEINRRSERGPLAMPRPLLALGALIGGLAIVVLAAWLLTSRNATAGRNSLGSSASAVALATEVPTPAAAPTAAPRQPTAQPAAASVPTAAPSQPPTVPPTAAATEQPTAAPTEQPTEPPTPAPTAAPTPAETGTLLLRDNFTGAGWASINGGAWRVGYARGRYRVYGDTNTGAIWSYRTAPAPDTSIGVDVQVPQGEGGLLVRFVDEANYTSITVNPSQTSFRIEQHAGGAISVLAGGQTEVIDAGGEAINRLATRVRGERIQLLINGQQVADVVAQGSGDSARYGLLVIARDTPAEAYFDNLEIRQLDN